MGVVRGILLDQSVIFSNDVSDDANVNILSSVHYLLRKLRYAGLLVGIAHEQSLSSSKESLLHEISSTYSCSIFCSSPDMDILIEVARIWEGEGSFIHVVSSRAEDYCSEERGSVWLNVLVGSDVKHPPIDADGTVATGIPNIFINKLEELLLLIGQLNKKACNEDSFIVGYVMKPSREEDFSKRGAFPLSPAKNGLIFVPLSFEISLSVQIQLVDAVLHKATDEIFAVDMGSNSELKVIFTRNFQGLQSWVERQPGCCVIDPFDNISPLLDRLKIQQILVGLETVNNRGRSKIRAPHYLKLDNFDEPNLKERLAEAKLSLPTIVKPQVACGVSNAHSMAITFEMNHFENLNVPIPALVQEYVDHSSLLYKFYVLGSKKFYAIKKSTPNADTLRNLFADKGLEPLYFDSLKSLPVSKDQPDASNHHIDLELVSDAADWLRGVLDLTLIGFDVVVQESTGDHVIVDVNYLPSFKEVPDDVVIPAFWDALKDKILSVKSKQAEETL